MTTWLVSRHPGAFEWAREAGLRFDRHVAGLEPDDVREGDVVAGNLPAPVVAALCERGASYLHLHLPDARWLREHRAGGSLSGADMWQLGACLRQVYAAPVYGSPALLAVRAQEPAGVGR